MSRESSEAIAVELERLARFGKLQPSDVVSAARKESSPLHKWFTWDDDEAAEAWRLHEARNLIRVYAVRELEKEEPDLQRVHVSLRSDRKDGGYRVLADVLDDEELRGQMLADALEDLRYFRRKYQRLKELDPVFVAAASVEETASPRLSAAA